MSNSSLVNHTQISPNKTSPRNQPISKITVHHMAGNLSVETCGNVFAPSSRQASANYSIGTDGRVGLYVDEGDRSWASSSAWNDNRAVTIEVANDEIGGNWHVSDAAWNKLVDLCVDICKRNGMTSLTWTGDQNGSLTCHYMFAATACPGPYLKGRMADLAQTVTARLGGASAPATGGSSAPTGTATELAQRVIAGEFGNGEQRKAALGSRYDEVQAEVNRILGGGSTQSAAVDIDDLARRTIAGEFGNGDARKAALGANYDAVQARVNEMLGAGGSSAAAVDIDALAQAVIRGEYSNGEERKQRLGANYEAVQARVNQLLS